jgi:hypothetical protein
MCRHGLRDGFQRQGCMKTDGAAERTLRLSIIGKNAQFKQFSGYHPHEFKRMLTCINVTNILVILVHTSSEKGGYYPYNPTTFGQYLTILTEIKN